MPTTLLYGETWEQAYARRFREEVEISARYEALEREHLGDFDKKTGIYAANPVQEQSK